MCAKKAIVTPKTAENFRALCTGERGIGKSGKQMHHKGMNFSKRLRTSFPYRLCTGSQFHQAIHSFTIQGGDYTNGDGTGWESVFGFAFEDENFDILHYRPFLVAMANAGKGTNTSQFIISTAPNPHLDYRHVIFGQVVYGRQVVRRIENNPVEDLDKPRRDCHITGEYRRNFKNSIFLHAKPIAKQTVASTTAISISTSLKWSGLDGE